MITIVDYGLGNLGSIRNMLKKIGHPSQITSDPGLIERAEKLLLPGVGSFDAGMQNLARGDLIPLLNHRVLDAAVPVLGICLGMQLMTHSSEEGALSGLGWIDAHTVRFDSSGPELKVPHMGWNLVRRTRTDPLTDSLPSDPRFYFVHSYRVRCGRDADVTLVTNYGSEFHSGFRRANIWGVQFHPEKSHRFGMQLLRNFAERC